MKNPCEERAFLLVSSHKKVLIMVLRHI